MANLKYLQYLVTKHSLVLGIVLMFLFTWPIDLSNAGVLPFQVPFIVYILLGYGFVAASVIMTGLTLGKGGVVSLLKRYLIWKVSWKWYLVAFLLLPAIQIVSMFLISALSGNAVDFNKVMAYEIFEPGTNLILLVIPWFLYEIFTNGEEIGWRGYILPRLQVKYGALVSSMLVGLIWGLWHVPKFIGNNAGNEQSFGWFLAAHLALAVLYTWLFNNTQGSLLLVTIFHASTNTAGMFFPDSFAASGGILPNLQIVFYILAAVAVTALTSSERLSFSKNRQRQELFRVQ